MVLSLLPGLTYGQTASVETVISACNAAPPSGTASKLSTACANAVAAYIAALKLVNGATTASVDAGIAQLVYSLATANIATGAGEQIAAAIEKAAESATSANLKANAKNLALDVSDGKVDMPVLGPTQLSQSSPA